jgi:hypothetical protein
MAPNHLIPASVVATTGPSRYHRGYLLGDAEMHASIDRVTGARLLDELREKDTQRKVFGSMVHDYKLNAPVSASMLESFEKQHLPRRRQGAFS